MKRFWYFWVLILIMIGVSCSSEEENAATIDIALDFQKYVDLFVEEAAARGIDVDFSDTGLSVQFDQVPQEAAGVCSELGDATSGSHQIRIKKSYWDQLIDSERERLVFHELGHCELHRTHDNQIFSNGDWKSIMRGDPLPEGKTILVNYSGSRKKYYIDELFNPSISRPDWLNIIANYDDVNLEQKSTIYEETNVETFNKITGITGESDFEIEVVMEQLGGLDFMGFLWSGGDIPTSLHLYFNRGNKLYVSSGDLLYGHMHIFDFNNQVSFNKNKLTIRKSGDYYYYFLNEEYIYWTDFQEMTSSRFQSLVHRDVQGIYESVKLSLIE